MIYKVVCKECRSEDYIEIDKGRVQWTRDNIMLSARYRLDNQWGWECRCGNYDITTEQERRQIKNLQNPDPKDIHAVIKNLKPDKPKFVMEASP